MGIPLRSHPSMIYVSLLGLPKGKGDTLQRLFSTFPGGCPGIGLLLLRSTTGIVLIFEGASALMRSDTPMVLTGTFALIAMASGVSLLLGLFTPVGGVLAALCSVAAALLLIPVDALDSQIRPAAVLVAVMAVSLGLLGPGAFSLDSRLFGRREIVIPQLSRSENHR